MSDGEAPADGPADGDPPPSGPPPVPPSPPNPRVAAWLGTGLDAPPLSTADRLRVAARVRARMHWARLRFQFRWLSKARLWAVRTRLKARLAWLKLRSRRQIGPAGPPEE